MGQKEADNECGALIGGKVNPPHLPCSTPSGSCITVQPPTCSRADASKTDGLNAISKTGLDLESNIKREIGASDFNQGQQLQLLLQAQTLLAKNLVYQRIDISRRQLDTYRTQVYCTLPRDSSRHGDGVVTASQRDAAVSSLRFLNIFCNCSPETFCLSVGLLDRLISCVQVHSNYLSTVSTCCYYLAARACEPASALPDPSQLLKLSRHPSASPVLDMKSAEQLILNALRQSGVSNITALTMLELFLEVFRLHLSSNSGSGHASLLTSDVQAAIVAKLELLLCQFEFTRFRGDVLALALLVYELQESGILTNEEMYTTIVELQYYCQISDTEFVECRGMVMDFLTFYHRQPSRTPRLQLCWSISRRALHKMRPSTRAAHDLEPILEDEDAVLSCDDSGPFDSENDEEPPSPGDDLMAAPCFCPHDASNCDISLFTSGKITGPKHRYTS